MSSLDHHAVLAKIDYLGDGDDGNMHNHAAMVRDGYEALIAAHQSAAALLAQALANRPVDRDLVTKAYAALTGCG